ncbi:MAG: hypothetical protein ACYC3L_04100 [Gemmatimonadaceae bacterium]
MSVRTMLLALGAIVMAVPAGLGAQETDADFVLARKQFVAGQARQAANTLLASSAHVRQEIGRCRDEEVGTRLIEGEAMLDKLASQLRAGTVSSVKVLDEALVKIDRALYQNHLKLAQTGIVRPRPDDIPVLTRDIEHAAYHFERSITLTGGSLTEEQVKAVESLRKLAKEIDDTKAVPKEAKAILAAYDAVVNPSAPAK